MALKKFMKKMFKGGGSEQDDLQQLLDSSETGEQVEEENNSIEDNTASDESLDVSFGASEEESSYNAVVDVFVNDRKLTTFNVSDDQVNIGRDPSHCSVLITEPIVSKVHCVIFLQDGDLCIRDKESTNGIFIGGEKVTESIIEEGTMISLGRKGVVKLEVKNSALS